MKKCPFCDWEVWPKAQKCKHCGEWLWKKPEHKWNKFKTFLSEYWIFLAIWILILFLYFQPEKDQSNTGTINRETTTNNDNLSNEQEYELVGDSKDVIANNKWFTIFPNKVWECNIEWDTEITDFVDAIRKAKVGEKIDRTCPNQRIDSYTNDNNSYIAFLFDNSYSENLNWNLDKEWPNQRMATIWNYLTNRKFTNGTSLDFIFMFTVQPNDNSEEPDSNLYHFWIDTSKFSTIYIKDWKTEPFYDDKRKTLIFRDVKLRTELSWWNQTAKCIKKNNYDFICYDAESVYQKIQDIYSKTYDKEDKHTNNMFIKTLAMNQNWFSWNEKDEIFIFTNWEFKIWYERETMYLSDLKAKYKRQWKHDEWADKTHNLTDFNMRYANRYQKDSKYESFRSDAIDILQPQIPNCEWVTIHVIWLTRSTEFKPLAEKIYKKIFEPCEVLFQ